ncbi:MAG: hypothetical protein RLZZ623_2869 [Actinomycetota bacterium]
MFVKSSPLPRSPLTPADSPLRFRSIMATLAPPSISHQLRRLHTISQSTLTRRIGQVNARGGIDVQTHLRSAHLARRIHRG